MKQLAGHIFWRLLKIAGYGLTGALIVLLVVAVYYLNSRPDLKIWHHANLDKEFTEDTPVRSFTEYLALEKQLFRQLDEEVYENILHADHHPVNRYYHGSLSDPARWPINWNRSFELPRERATAGVVLLHGLSDSPYSLRSLGKRLHTSGAWVVGLRLPGHGTAPAALTRTNWRDMAAAVRLAMSHIHNRVGDTPIYIVGYSTGAALAIHYSLQALTEKDLPSAQGLVLLAPAIGVSPAAALAVWQARLGLLLGLEKLEWSTVLPEYDPYKYNSFAINAGDQIYRMTLEIQSQINTLAPEVLQEFPPLLAFQSAIDATVSTPDLVDKLLALLPPDKHELVIFDINRVKELEYILAKDPAPWLDTLLDNDRLPFTVSVLTNQSPDSMQIVIRRKQAGTTHVETRTTQLRWPDDVYAISHVALPFSPLDPLYGNGNSSKSPGIQLGNLALRGERGVLRLSGTDMLRLRWNPFYSFVEESILNFMALQNPQ